MMLSTLQQQFHQAYNNENQLNTFLAQICDSTTLSAKQRFEIYADSISECRARALREIYPVCEQLVGKENFNRMAYRYVASIASISPDLNDYGEDFPDFVEQFPPAQELPYLRDLCLLEWAWHIAYDYPDTPSLNFEALNSISEQQQPHIIFHLPENANLLYSPYPIATLWQATMDNQLDDDSLEIEDAENQLIIWRDQNEIRIDRLNDIEWEILMLISKGMPFGELCEAFIQRHPALDMTEILPQIVSLGWIGGFEMTEENA